MGSDSGWDQFVCVNCTIGLTLIHSSSTQFLVHCNSLLNVTMDHHYNGNITPATNQWFISRYTFRLYKVKLSRISCAHTAPLTSQTGHRHLVSRGRLAGGSSRPDRIPTTDSLRCAAKCPHDTIWIEGGITGIPSARKDLTDSRDRLKSQPYSPNFAQV